MKINSIILFFLSLTLNLFAQNNSQTDKINFVGVMDNWVVREIKESGIIGGNTKYLYEPAPGDTIKGFVPYVNSPNVPWSTSNVLAKVKGIVKASCTVFPEKRGEGYCARLETRLEKVKVLGIINMEVLASGTLFLGAMLEPITGTKNPQSKLNCGVPFNYKPKGISFDYKVTIGHDRIKSSGFGAMKHLGDSDYAECVIMLQKRWEDKEGRVFAKRVGTGYYRFDKTEKNWINNFFISIKYGDITKESFYKPYMQLIPEDLSNYMINSKGESVPILEQSWGNTDDEPTHIIIRFSSSHGEAYVGDINN